MTVVLLVAAVLTSTVASYLMKASEGLRRPAQAVGALLLYTVAIAQLAILATRLPVALVYALWGGCAVFTSALMGWLVFQERVTRRGVIGMFAIASGVAALSWAR